MRHLYIVLITFLILGACGSPSKTETEDTSIKQKEPETAELNKTLAEQAAALSQKTDETKNSQLDVEIQQSWFPIEGFGFDHTGNTSPDSTTVLEFEEVDPTASSLAIVKGESRIEVADLYVTPAEVAWSENGKFVAINSEDMYAGSGAMTITVVEVSTGKYVEISYSKFAERVNIGKREMFNNLGIYWIGERTFYFGLDVDYLGESGHPGIDSNRKSELGDDFGTSDPFPLGEHVVEVLNGDESEYALSAIKRQINQMDLEAGVAAHWKGVESPLIATFSFAELGDYFHFGFTAENGQIYQFGDAQNEFGDWELFDEDYDGKPEYLNKKFAITWEWRTGGVYCCDGAMEVYEMDIPTIVRLALLDETFTEPVSAVKTAKILLHAPGGDFSKANENDVINYITWDGSKWSATLNGNTFTHALDGDFSNSKESNIINYITSGGGKWTAKVNNNEFTHAPNGDFKKSHNDVILIYQSWDKSNWTMKFK